MQTILIIDDDAAHRESGAGGSVTGRLRGAPRLFRHGGAASAERQPPDLVLLDLMLPGLSGEEVLPQLQGISVIVVSAKTAVQDKVGLLLAKSVLFDRIGVDTPDCTEGSPKTHISNLRGKLRDATGKDHIEAVWGIGFRLRPES